MTTQKRTRIALLALIALLLGVLAFLFANLVPLAVGADQPQRWTRVHRGVTSQVSLAEAEPRAAARAHQWIDDAQLVRVQATWHVTEGWQEVEVPPTAWTFYYYAPSDGSVAAVSVNDEETLWTPPFEVSSTPPSLASFPPPSGVDAAWLAFRDAGGEGFLTAHDEAEVRFRLQQKDGRYSWSVMAFDGSDATSVTIDAETGALIE